MNFTLSSLLETFAEQASVAFSVETPEGGHYRVGNGESVFTLRFHTGKALAACFLRGHMGALEAYFDGEVDLDGDLGAALAAGLRIGFDMRSAAVNGMENSLLEWRSSNRDRAQAKLNARAHYGLPEAFYRWWLDDPLKVYTCAYWRDGVSTLEQAQCDKIDHVCRKLQLSENDRYLDIGCGFGGFLFRAYETVGAQGTGVNTATEQVHWLRGEISRRGLQQHLRVRDTDFRDVDGHYDKIVSIGVLEHAGRDQLDEVIRAHADALKPGGLGMLHFIGHISRRETELFIRKHVFPGGWIPALADVITAMERCGLEVLDIENLRRHYALTLDEWARRFDRAWPSIHAMDPLRFNERFRRVWRVYLIGCAEMFRSPTGQTHLFQVLFSKGHLDRHSYPMTRDYVYR